MGRPVRDVGVSKVIATRYSAPEMKFIEEMMAAWGTSPSETTRRFLHQVRDSMGGQAPQIPISPNSSKIRNTGFEDHEIFMTKENIQSTIESLGLKDAEEQIIPQLMGILKSRLEEGFFYPPETLKTESVLSDLRNGKSVSASKLLKAKFKSYWESSDGPALWSMDDPRWLKLIKDRAGFNKRQEFFDLSFEALRRGLQVHRHVVSFFQPHQAYDIYRHCLGKTQNPIVWDPSCGFGARLLAFAAAYPKGTYIGTEPSTKTFSELQNLSTEIPCKTILKNIGSEDADIEESSLDLVFTSPPYFNVEKYNRESTQSWVKFPTWELWSEEFLKKTLSTAAKGLKKGGYLVINSNERIAEETKKHAQTLGLHLTEEKDLNVKKHPFSKGKEKHLEPVLYFVK